MPHPTPSNDPSRPPTIYDISAAAGVAASTVSKVLGLRASTYSISAETRDRILAVAKELGYMTDPSQRHRRGRRTGVIGVMYGTAVPLNTPVYESITDRLESTMATAGYRMQFFPAGTWTEMRDHLNTHAMDGVLLVPNLPPGEPEAREALNLPMVVLNDHCSLPIPQVVCDDTLGMTLAMEHLLGLGHQRIVFADINDRPREHGSENIRRNAYCAAMMKHGLTPDTMKGGAAAVLDHVLKVKGTAILTYNNQMALALLPLLRQRGLRLPDDLSLVSGTDLRVGSLVEPGLTAMVVPMGAMADRACAELFAIIQGQAPIEEPCIMIPPTMAIRGSSGPPPHP